ncbi:MAG: 30S ribosomal protein S3 [Anaerolineae bacterium]|nr:30S ribosomal protein S3 [Anaerolineae bacterium]
MGRKVHPNAFRLGIIRTWDARWYAEGEEYGKLLMEDIKIREMIRKELPNAGISKIEIERFPNQVSIVIHTAKPGIIIGRKGAGVNKLRQLLEDFTKKRVRIDVEEIEKPELDAYLVAESIAEQLERRVSFKRAMKQAVLRALRAGALGAMVTCSGRLGGAEMARKDTVRMGRVPRHTLRADIDYAKAEALTTFGRIGVKVWIYKGDVLPEKKAQAEQFAEAGA